MWLGIIVLGALLTVFLTKENLPSKKAEPVVEKTEQTKKEGTKESVDLSNTSIRKLTLVLDGLNNLYSDKETKTFRTDIKQSEIDDLKELIAEVNNESLKERFYSDLEKVEVSK